LGIISIKDFLGNLARVPVSASGLCKHQPWVTQDIALGRSIMRLSLSSARFVDWTKEAMKIPNPYKGMSFLTFGVLRNLAVKEVA
jgi:hypothetical protein